MSQTSQVFLLAAGKGTRAGGPKAWMEHQGEPLLKKQIDFLLQIFDAERITVSIQDGWASRCRILNERVKWIATDPDASPLASLQTLMKGRAMVRWSFVYHVDQPVWETAVFHMLLRETAHTNASVLVPTNGGKRGHPVLISHGLGPALLDLDPAKDRLDAFIKTQLQKEIELPFPCVLENWNEARARQ